jgi:hypothetical protein
MEANASHITGANNRKKWQSIGFHSFYGWLNLIQNLQVRLFAEAWLQ